MNTEKTHYRTIPEDEYQELKALAEGNERAIRKIMSDSLFYKELDILKDKMHETKSNIRTWLLWFDDILVELRSDSNLSTKQSIRKLIELKEKL